MGFDQNLAASHGLGRNSWHHTQSSNSSRENGWFQQPESRREEQPSAAEKSLFIPSPTPSALNALRMTADSPFQPLQESCGDVLASPTLILSPLSIIIRPGDGQGWSSWSAGAFPPAQTHHYRTSGPCGFSRRLAVPPLFHRHSPAPEDLGLSSANLWIPYTIRYLGCDLRQGFVSRVVLDY